MNRRVLEREIRRGARLVALVRENLHTLLACLLACDQRDLAEQIASTMGGALWRHDLCGPAGRPVPAVAAFAAKIRAELASMGIQSPDDLAAYAATFKRPT